MTGCARRKRLLRAREDERAHPVVLAERVVRIFQREHDLGVERVERPRPVDRERRDGAVFVNVGQEDTIRRRRRSECATRADAGSCAPA